MDINEEDFKPLILLNQSDCVDKMENKEASSKKNLIDSDLQFSSLFEGSFFKYVPEKSTPTRMVGMCVKCLPARTVEISGRTKCSSNFVTHLRRVHGPAVYQQYRRHIQIFKIKKKAIIENYFADETISMNQLDCVAETSNAKEASPKEASPGIVESHSQCHSSVLDGTFFKIVPEKSSAIQKVAICMRCLPNTVEIKGHINSTSNYVTHLKRVHGPAVIEEYRKHLKVSREKKKGKIGSSRNSVKEINMRKDFASQEKIESDLTNYFIHAMIPLQTVEDPYFVRMINNSNTDENVKAPGLCSFRRIIEYKYFTQKGEININLANAKHLCTTADIWTENKISLLGVMIHWINDNLERKSAALACRRLQGALKFDHITGILFDIYNDYDLDTSKDEATVIENSPNYGKTFEMFGVKSKFTKFENEETSDSEVEDSLVKLHSSKSPLPDQYTSCAHSLTLCVSTDVQYLLQDETAVPGKFHQSAINKCNQLWNFSVQSESVEIMQSTLGYILSVPEVTRWNSLYDSLKQITETRNKNLQLSQALGIKNVFSDNEYDYLEEYVECTAPIAAAIDILQGGDTFYGIVLPSLLTVRKKLQKLSRREWTYCRPLVNKYLESIQERFKQFFDMSNEAAEIPIIASLSYPRFKNKWYSCINYDEQRKCNELFKDAICFEMNNNTNKQLPETKAVAQKHDAFFDFNSDSGDESDSITPKNEADILMSCYFAEESTRVNLLQQYPIIKKVFLKYNTPMPSFGPVERMFSFLTTNSLPKSLCDEMFEHRVVMRSNLNYIKHYSTEK